MLLCAREVHERDLQFLVVTRTLGPGELDYLASLLDGGRVLAGVEKAPEFRVRLRALVLGRRRIGSECRTGRKDEG
jgi:hypothetical protein